MEDKEQQEFISWLKDQLQAKDDSDFQQKVQQLGEEGIKKAHITFKRAKVTKFLQGGAIQRAEEMSKTRHLNKVREGAKTIRLNTPISAQLGLRK